MKPVVLHVSNAFPTNEHPEYGVFIKEQVCSLAPYSDNVVVMINGRENGWIEYLRARKRIKTQLEACDLVHCHHLFSFFAFLLCFDFSKPVVLSFLNSWTTEIELPLPAVMKQLVCLVGIALADRVIFKCPVPEGIPFFRKKCVHLPNGVNLDYFSIIPQETARQQLGLPVDAKVLLFVSSKHLHRKQKRYDIFLQIVGAARGVMPDVLDVAICSETQDRTRLFFNAADALILTSDFEGSPNSLKEALACGVPVIAHDVGDVAEILKNVPFCSLISQQNVELYTRCVLDLLAAPVDRDSIRNAFIENGYADDLVAQNLSNLYANVLEVREH